MNYRNIVLEALTAAFSDNRTITIDLNMADPISEIYLDIRATNIDQFVSTVGAPLETVTKIEIVDGSDVLYSLTGLEAEALDIYHSGQYPRGQRSTYQNSQENTHIVAISFGRYLWDEILAFDPKKFINPQLKISFDYDAGGATPTAAKLKVIAALFDEKAITPQGFLMSKEIKSWTTVAAAHEYTDLPTDYVYRKLLLLGRYNDNPPNWVFGNIKLSQDQDKKVILNNELLELVSGIAKENAYVNENIIVSGSAAAAHFHVTPTMDVVVSGAPMGVETGGKEASFDGGDGGYVGYITEAAYAQNVKVSGMCPHGCIAIPFGKQDIIEDWFDPSGIGSLILDVTDGVSSATSRLFIQQFRKYA